MTRSGSRRAAGESGVIAVIAALAMPLLLGMAAIVIDLGQAYATGRQMQNASDSAALAATRALDKVRFSRAAPSTVDEAARLVATRNGARSDLVTCTVIQWTGTPIGPCSDTLSVSNHLARGVMVQAGGTRPTAFARAVGVDSVRADRRAAATIQTLVGQDSPLLVCAFGQTGDLGLPAPDLLVGLAGSFTINPLAVGQRYLLHGPRDVAGCGLNPSWKGDAGPGPFVLPNWLPIATGDKAGPIRSQIAGQPGCAPVPSLGCVLVLPICSLGAGSGINGRLFCERFGAFKLVAARSNEQVFEFVGGAAGTTGIGGNGLAGADDVRLVKLIL